MICGFFLSVWSMVVGLLCIFNSYIIKDFVTSEFYTRISSKNTNHSGLICSIISFETHSIVLVDARNDEGGK